MTYYARSATSLASNQPYNEHIANVWQSAVHFWDEAAFYWHNGSDVDRLARLLRTAAIFHDLGKLDDVNQRVLAGNSPNARLPVPHQDAGVAHLLTQKEFLAALLVYSHHIGLPDLHEIQNQHPPMRLADADKRIAIDNSLPELLQRHLNSGCECPLPQSPIGVSDAFNLRLLFSCLTDADHGDAAMASGASNSRPLLPELRPLERLEALKRYIASLPPASSPEEYRRNEFRSKFFNSCLEYPVDSALTECDAPVGTGKTTAVMAHLLRLAQTKGLRRIFVILPFTNIISQSVEVYRKALVLAGEEPEKVVAELHHRADFDNRESRQLTALWNAPIVVTTAVAFFETLASNHPATLRRLHNLPGSAVFLDEAHAMLPVKLLPLAWQWINFSAQNWQCFWTLASGSLSRFWELDEFSLVCETAKANQSLHNITVQNIIPIDTKTELASSEISRVTYRHKKGAMSVSTFVDWLTQLDGPVLVVLNTVHTAASIARLAAEKFGTSNVLHLSTALSPDDRDVALNVVKARLRCKDDVDWFLFATSCVEAGMDLSFRTGVREGASLSSLLQLAGRVNRNARFSNADVWTVTLNTNDPNVITNPAWTVSARILSDFFEDGATISPALCTEALKRELRERGISSELEALKQLERTRAFRTLETKFRVIEDNSVPVVVNAALIERIERFDSISWRDIQNSSVQVRKHLVDKLAIEESRRYPGLFLWKYAYSPFLGYMEGLLQLSDIDKDKCAIL